MDRRKFISALGLLGLASTTALVSTKVVSGVSSKVSIGEGLWTLDINSPTVDKDLRDMLEYYYKEGFKSGTKWPDTNHKGYSNETDE